MHKTVSRGRKHESFEIHTSHARFGGCEVLNTVTFRIYCTLYSCCNQVQWIFLFICHLVQCAILVFFAKNAATFTTIHMVTLRLLHNKVPQHHIHIRRMGHLTSHDNYWSGPGQIHQNTGCPMKLKYGMAGNHI